MKCDKMTKDSLGNRMKTWENVTKYKLEKKMPVIMRLDGKNFSRLTKKFTKPFDSFIKDSLIYSTFSIMKEIQGAKLAYLQSDEVSILVTDWEKENTSAWFDYNVQKMVSVSAAMMSVIMSRYIDTRAFFDCRVFNLPFDEVSNYFIWRQQDWERNSISSLAQHYYSHRELHGKSKVEQLEMIKAIGDSLLPSWDDLANCWKYGTIIANIPENDRENINMSKFFVNENIKKFIDDRTVIEQFLQRPM